MNLSTRDTQLTELMDDVNCDPEKLARTLRRFALVNRLVAGWGPLYRREVRAVLAALQHTRRTSSERSSSSAHHTPFRILDIGCGAGDVLRHVVSLARTDGFAVEGLGIDPDHRALAVAHETPLPAGVTFRQAHSSDLVAEGATFDIVLSNHLLHHLSDADCAGLFADSERLTTGLCLHSDIGRGTRAYAAYCAGITPLAPGSFLRTDGLRSIRRSYTRAELQDQLPARWQAAQTSAFRIVAVHRPADVSRHT